MGGRPDRKLRVMRLCQRAGLTRDEAKAKVDQAVAEAAQKEQWRPVEHAMALAAWYRALDSVYREPKRRTKGETR